MRCPKCGNEISQEEAFCGQCGTSTLPLTQPGLPSSYNTNMAPPTSPNRANTSPPSQSHNGGPPALSLPSRRPLTPGQPQPPLQPPSAPEQPGFYADPTEAFSVLPSNGTPSYPQQNFPGTPGPYNPQVQPLRLGNYASPSYPQTPPSGPSYGYGMQPPSGPSYGYGMQPNSAPPPRKERSNTILIVASVFLIVALLLVTGLGAFYLLRNQSSQAGNATPNPVATATTSSSPAPTSTVANTPTPVPTPSPTAVPSPIAEAGFTFCDATCTSNGFSVEYPSKWQQGSTIDHTGIQFSSASAQDEYAAFKVAGSTQATANDLIKADLANFASKPGYTAPTSSQSTTISGLTWVYAVANYTLNDQTERVQVYATVRQGKAYVIELNAPDSRFDAANSKYFVTMLGSFKFQ